MMIAHIPYHSYLPPLSHTFNSPPTDRHNEPLCSLEMPSAIAVIVPLTVRVGNCVVPAKTQCPGDYPLQHHTLSGGIHKLHRKTIIISWHCLLYEKPAVATPYLCIVLQVPALQKEKPLLSAQQSLWSTA